MKHVPGRATPDIKLTGQTVLSDLDGAFYATIDAKGNWINLGDKNIYETGFLQEFAPQFNKNYRVGGLQLPESQYLISHGGFTEIPDYKIATLDEVQGRVQAILHENTLIFAHLPSQDVYGFYGVIPFEEVLGRLRIDKFKAR